MSKPRWPEHAVLLGISADHKPIFKSTNRMCDLHDSLCRNLEDDLEAEYFLAVAIDHPSWRTANDEISSEGIWDEQALREIERAIEEDFAFDDYSVELTRIAGNGWPKSCTAIWKIEPRDADDLEEFD